MTGIGEPVLNLQLHLAALLVLPLVAGGCVSASLEDAAPRTVGETPGAPNQQPDQAGQPPAGVAGANAQAGNGAARPQRSRPERDTSFVQEGAVQDDTFPTFGGTPTNGAMEQLSEEEKQQILNEMDAILKQRKPASAKSTSDTYAKQSQELDEIARSHGDEAKSEIEN